MEGEHPEVLLLLGYKISSFGLKLSFIYYLTTILFIIEVNILQDFDLKSYLLLRQCFSQPSSSWTSRHSFLC